MMWLPHNPSFGVAAEAARPDLFTVIPLKEHAGAGRHIFLNPWRRRA